MQEKWFSITVQQAYLTFLHSQLEETRKELNESRAKAIKLASKEEWNTERFKIAQDNSSGYKREIGLLEERNKALDAIVAKHEASIESFQKEVSGVPLKLKKIFYISES